ncbi:MAG: hypothetical protein AAGM22_30235 [Acidobacteriota bacterium]
MKILPVLLLVLAAVPAGAEERLAQVVDSDGMLLTLVSGDYGTLFPEGNEASKRASVLALDAVLQNDERHRLLVPSTASSWPESSASLLYDAGAGVTYVLWSAPFNGLHPMLYLTTFDGSSWGQVLEIVGTIFAPKMDLQLVVSHDSYSPSEDGPTLERTVIHVAWWEPRAAGVEKQYTALVLENGAYVGRTLSHSLTPAGGLFDQTSLATELVLQSSTNGNLITGFHDPVSGELSSLQVEVLPVALSLLASRVEDAVAVWSPESGEDLLGTVDKALRSHGSAFHPAVLDLLSIEVRRLFEEAEGDIQSLTEKFGPHIIHIGMTVGANGLVSEEAVGLLTIRPTHPGDFIGPRHDLKVSSLGRWPVPTALGTNPEFMLSADGGDALVSWFDEESAELRYVETLADSAWSDVRALKLSEDFGVDEALKALAEHLRDR